MTGVWGFIFSINLMLALVIVSFGGPLRFFIQVATYILLIAGIIFTISYPDYVKKRWGSRKVQAGLELEILSE